MDKLELKHIAPYLPYGLKVLSQHGEVSEINSINWSLDGHLRTELNLCVQKSPSRFRGANLEHIKPILRPLSDLTKEITIKGEAFVPLVELFNIKYARGAYDILDTYSHGHMHTIKVSWDKVRSSISRFTYNSESGSFVFVDNNKHTLVSYQLEMFNKLYEWYFDLNNLIESGLAVDVNTINQ